MGRVNPVNAPDLGRSDLKQNSRERPGDAGWQTDEDESVCTQVAKEVTSILVWTSLHFRSGF